MTDDPLIGTLLDQYEVLSMLAEGPNARVYWGRQTAMDREVAIKVYQTPLKGRRAVDRFRREANVVASLEHITIAPVFAVGEHEGLPFVAMRYFESGSLSNLLLHEGALPPGNAIRILQQIGGALAHAHDHDVVHRNLRTSNVLFDSTGNSYVSDFLLETLGIPLAIVPEETTQWPGPVVDVYRMGVVAYEMLAGRPPFSTGDPEELAAMHRSAPVTSLTQINPELPPSVSDVVDKALAKQPEDRYASPLEFAESLHDVVTQVGLGDVQSFDTLDLGPVVAERETTLILDAVEPVVPLPAAAPDVRAQRPAGAPRNRMPLVILGIVAAGLIIAGAVLGLTGALRQFTDVPDLAAESVATPLPPTAAPVAEVAAPTATSPPEPTVAPTAEPTLPEPTIDPNVTPTITLDLANLPPLIYQYGVPMVLVPAGTFDMGDLAVPDQRPVHRVTLDDYYIDQYEVTNFEYKLCEDDGVCDPQTKTISEQIFGYYGTEFYANYPVIFMSWETSVQYCEWREARLPTEAEWEKAARWNPETGETNRYPWGNDFPRPELANYRGAGPAHPEAVDSYPEGASAVGAYNMSGNVLEWVTDWYDANYYEVSPVENPLGPETGELKVLRSSSYLHSSGAVIPTTRWQYSTEFTAGDFGFRCALTPGEGGGISG